MSSTGLPLGLQMPQESDSPSNTKLDHSHQDSFSSSSKHKKSASKLEQDEEQDSDSGPSGRAKPVLSEEQKKANHIHSEQKRREKIREQYDKLAELIPGMKGHGRSEGKVLEEAVRFAQDLRQERGNLIRAIEDKGGIVPPELKKY